MTSITSHLRLPSPAGAVFRSRDARKHAHRRTPPWRRETPPRKRFCVSPSLPPPSPSPHSRLATHAARSTQHAARVLGTARGCVVYIYPAPPPARHLPPPPGAAVPGTADPPIVGVDGRRWSVPLRRVGFQNQPRQVHRRRAG